jgi:hypothetical protein
MLQAGSIVRHDVVEAREEGGEVTVAVETLVGAAVVA